MEGCISVSLRNWNLCVIWMLRFAGFEQKCHADVGFSLMQLRGRMSWGASAHKWDWPSTTACLRDPGTAPNTHTVIRTYTTIHTHHVYPTPYIEAFLFCFKPRSWLRWCFSHWVLRVLCSKTCAFKPHCEIPNLSNHPSSSTNCPSINPRAISVGH